MRGDERRWVKMRGDERRWEEMAGDGRISATFGSELEDDERTMRPRKARREEDTGEKKIQNRPYEKGEWIVISQ